MTLIYVGCFLHETHWDNTWKRHWIMKKCQTTLGVKIHMFKMHPSTHICFLWFFGFVDLKCHNPTKLVFAWYIKKIFRWFHFSSTQMKPYILIVFRREQNFPQKWSKLLGDLDLCSWVTIQLFWIFKKNPQKLAKMGKFVCQIWQNM